MIFPNRSELPVKVSARLFILIIGAFCAALSLSVNI